jgi:hypothetical protein
MILKMWKTFPLTNVAEVGKLGQLVKNRKQKQETFRKIFGE